jgi:predicted nucleic acid-binding protein
MNGDVAYLDASAAVKLLLNEPESTALRRWLAKRPRPASASFLRVELVRSIRRAGLPGLLARSQALLRTLDLVQVDEALFERAASLDPVELRSLDAIHVAAALELGGRLEAVVSYDERMLNAAEALGLPTARPGTRPGLPGTPPGRASR